MKLALDENLPRIKGNPGKLQQVFLNLFLNARDAMESGGVLAVADVPRTDGLVRVTVADSGAGIAPRKSGAHLRSVLHHQGARKKGTGLGLSVSYGIVREHGGDIEVREPARRGHAVRAFVPEAARKTKRSERVVA